MEIGDVLGPGSVAGAGDEFHFREFERGFDHEGLMAETVGEDNGAACVRQFFRGGKAFVRFVDADLLNVFDAFRFADCFCGAHEVEVVG